ncbi:ankyrin repeat-containing domain protein, partial [Baffinella frigidus]
MGLAREQQGIPADSRDIGQFCPTLLKMSRRVLTEEARQLLLGGANIEERGGRAPHLTTPLQIAGHQGHAEVVQLLLEHGALLNVKNNDGVTPLHHAARARRGREAVALVLLQHGADVTAEEAYGRTALHLAAFKGHGAMARLLLQHGADVSANDSHGLTALHIGAFQGHATVVRVLIEHRANVLAETNLGWTAVFIAAVHSHLEVVAMLKAEAVSRAKCVAFAMGHHARLGAGSMVEALDPEVVRK